VRANLATWFTNPGSDDDRQLQVSSTFCLAYSPHMKEQVLAAANCGSSVVQDRKAHLVQVCRIGDRIEGDDLAVPDCETQEEQ
jgi:hypothetical protein